MIFFTLIALSVAVFGLAEELTFPAPTCKRDLTDYSACLKRALEEAWPRFMKGLPEFNFTPMDPLVYERLHNEYQSNEITAVVTATNTTVYGMAGTKCREIRAHFSDNDDNFRLEVDILIPKMFIEGYVKARGSIANFKMGGEGYYNISIEEIRTTWDMMGSVVNDRWTVEHFRTLPQSKVLVVYFENLFEGKELNDIVIGFVNEFWPSLYRVMVPIMSGTWDKWLSDKANLLFPKVSFSKLFPK